MSKAKTTAGQRLLASAKEEAAKWRKRRNPLASAEAICPMVDRSGRRTDVEMKRLYPNWEKVVKLRES